MKDFLAEGFKTVQEIKKAELARTEEEKQRRAKGMAGASHVQPIDSAWSKLFEPFYIYNKYKHFIVLFAQSSCLADHLEWLVDFVIVDNGVFLMLLHSRRWVT